MPNTQIDQDVINRTVWEACDTFRGIVDSSIYKDYVLTMLFLKYISDVWQDHQHSMSSSAGELGQIFELPEEANFYALHAQRDKPGNGRRIDQALHLIELSNLDKLRNVFQDISFDSATRLGEEGVKNGILRHLLEDFAKPSLDLRPSRIGSLDVIGNAYEFLIKHFASDSGKKAGEFYTPAEVSQLMASLVDPQPGETIYDPSCGSGSLLMKCGRWIRQRDPQASYTLYGQESIGSTWALAKMNMFLHGETRLRIEWGDTLRQPKLVQADGSLMRFDVVVANPPFSLDKWGFAEAENDPWRRYERGIPPQKKADYAFILHMIESMQAEHGRMAVVVSGGVLFRGHAEGELRKKLIQENLLDCVIGLPPKLFYGTDIAASILIFKRQKQDRNVLFIDAGRDFHLEGERKQALLTAQDVQRIHAAFVARKEVADFAHLASPEEIAKNKFNLNILRYIPLRLRHDPLDLHKLQTEREQIQQQALLLESRITERMQGLLAQLPESGI